MGRAFANYFSNTYILQVSQKAWSTLSNHVQLKLINKPLYIAEADTKISTSGFQARVRMVGFKP